MSRLVLLVCVLTLYCIVAVPQNLPLVTAGSAASPKEILWVKQFPPVQDSATKKSFAKRVGEFISGKDESGGLIRPVAILARHPDSFMVLDQALGVIMEVQQKKASIPRDIRKKFDNFTSLVSCCETDKKDILFTDSKRNQVFRVTFDKKNLLPFSDTSLKQPTGIAFSPVSKETWVVETAAHRIAVLDEQGNRLRTIGKRGTGEGEFNFPTHLCIDASGNAYVVDAMNFRIQIFDNKGKFLSAFGEAGDVSGYFARPKGIALDSWGNIYIADALFHGVQVFNRSGELLYRFGVQGQEKGEFWMPNGIYIDRNNYIYVADTYNGRVQVFRVTGDR
jgi:hypothetical protein